MHRKSNLMMKTLAAGIVAGFATQANAVVTDYVYFRAAPIVMVWAASSTPTAAPVIADFVMLTTASGTAGADLIAGTNVVPVVTGTMTAIPTAAPAGYSLMSFTGATSGGVFTDNAATGELNAADALTETGLDATTDIGFAANTQQHSFYVASNAAFDVFALTGALTTTGDFSTLADSDISWSMAISTTGTDGAITYGANAQDPTTGGTGIIAATNLGSFSAQTKVFDGGRRTAASAGAIIAQSVRFTATYGLAYDLSMGTGSVWVPVTYTIYTP
jgi:hypothetical protein